MLGIQMIKIMRKPLKQMKIPKPKKPKKISDQVLDGLVREYIRLISGEYCKRCKKYVDGAIQVSHLYGRRRKTVRWDLRNVHPLCPDCHFKIDNDHLLKTSFQFDVLSPTEIEELEKLGEEFMKIAANKFIEGFGEIFEDSANLDDEKDE